MDLSLFLSPTTNEEAEGLNQIGPRATRCLLDIAALSFCAAEPICPATGGAAFRNYGPDFYEQTICLHQTARWRSFIKFHAFALEVVYAKTNSTCGNIEAAKTTAVLLLPR